MPLSRRTFLQSAAAGAAAASAVGVGRAWATATPNTKVLEIFCTGGFFHWLVGRPTGFGGPNPAWRNLSPGPNWSTIAGADPYRPSAYSSTWPVAASGIEWEAAAAPLFLSGLDMTTRYVAMGHEVEAHEPAIVHAFTGSKLGRARAASLGSVVNHAFAQSLGADFYSLILETAWNPNTYVARAAAASGLLGPAYAPVVVPAFSASVLSNFISTLSRPGRTASDGLKELYRSRYEAALTHSADGRVRAASFDAYQGALEQLFDHSALAALLSTAPMSWGPVNEWAQTFTDNSTRGAIRYGVELLRNTDLRHVTVIDHGPHSDYDGHNDRSPNDAGGNLWNVFRALGQLHQMVPLTDVMVVIHSEFSRVEYDGDTAGTEHWPWASANFYIGGPVTTSGLVGGYTEVSGPTVPYVAGYQATGHSATDMRAVCAWAAGVTDPFDAVDPYFDEDLAVSIPDEMVSSSATSAAATETIANSVLGI